MASILSYALTNLADVKESLGIASSVTKYDNLIIRKINAATLAIENYCGRRFKLTDYTEDVYASTNTDQIILRQRPIVDEVTLELRDSTLNDDDFETVDSDLYFINRNPGVLDLNFRSTGFFWAMWRVTYSAGYEDIPADLAEAAATLAAYYFTNAAGGSPGVTLKQEGQRKIQYSSAGLTFDSLMQQLGLDQIINAYANLPIMTDR